MLKEFYNNAAADADIERFVQNFDHHSDFFRSHYFNILERVAGREPALRSTAYDDGFSVATSYETIVGVSEQPELFSNRQGFRVLPRSVMPLLYPSDADGAEHNFFRQILNPQFTPAAMRQFRDSVAADIANFLDQAQKHGRIDFVDDFAQPITGRIAMRLLGLPEESWAHYTLPIHNISFSIGPLENRMADGEAFGWRVKEVVARMMATPDAPGLIGHLTRTELNGRKLTADEIEAIVLNVIIGGLDTTQATFGSVAVYLARNPERRRELADHPERIRAAVHEFLRVFSAASITGRYTERDVLIAGHEFRAGETTLLFWAAGNFDPEFVDRPFEIDFMRGHQNTMTFARGPHRCLGQQLAKMELEMMIEALVALPDYRLEEDRVQPAPDIASVLAYMHVPALLDPA